MTVFTRAQGCSSLLSKPLYILHTSAGKNKPCPMFYVCRPMHSLMDLKPLHVLRTICSSCRWTHVQCSGQGDCIINGHVKLGELRHALTAYKEMQDDSILLSGQTFVALLKACTEQKDMETGLEIHVDIARNGLLETDVFVGSTLIDMYAKDGSLLKAQEVFDMLTVRNVVTWNALIAGYTLHGWGEKALECFDQMQFEGVSPDAVTFTCSLKACARIKAFDKGCDVHSEILRKNLLNANTHVGNTLVDMYVKFGMLENAQEVFDTLHVRNVVTWTALIAGYTQHERGEDALRCFEQMQCEGPSPNAATYACALKACCNIGAIDKGTKMHARIANEGFLRTDVFVGSTLVDMYTKCGLQAKAQEVFDMLSRRNVVTWTALIAGYVQHEQNEQALNCFEQMQREDVSPNAVTFACTLKACGSIGAIDKGNEMYAEIARKGLLKANLIVGSALVDMYAKCSLLVKAQEVFNGLLVRDVVAWSAMISGYADHECGEEALHCFEQMQVEGIFADVVMFACSLKACSSIRSLEKGREVHAKIIEEGLQDADLSVGSALVDLYSKCGSLAKAQEVFDMLSGRNVVTWNALIAGYVRHEHGEDALNCFAQMQADGFVPDAVTFACALKACGILGATDKGIEIHAEVAKNGLLKKELSVGNALVDMYAKCSFLGKAREVFDVLSTKDVVTWNALIGGFAQQDGDEEALNCFEDMQVDGVSPNSVTFTCILKVCGSIGTGDKGGEIHTEIARKGLLKTDLFIGSVLVDMYAKCGLLAKATEVFNMLPVRNMVTWNALITGYSQLGEIETVLFIFNRMIEEGNMPDSVTIVSILNTCSHAGLVDMGCAYFEVMSELYGVTQTPTHHTCMIDLLGRAGQLDEAISVLKKTPYHPSIIMWLAVLGACRKWGNVELGRCAFDQAVRLDEKYAAAYICMLNIYADANMQEDARKVEAMRVEKQAWKKPGECCWTGIDGNVHQDLVGR